MEAADQPAEVNIIQPPINRVRNNFKGHAPIYRLQLLISLLFFTTIVFFGLKSIYTAATTICEHLKFQQLVDDNYSGRIFTDRFQDTADLEWLTVNHVWPTLITFGLLNAAASCLLSFLKLHRFRRLTVISTGMATIVTSTSLPFTALVVAELVVIYIAMRIGKFPLLLSWIVGTAHMFLPNPVELISNLLIPEGGSQFISLFIIWFWSWNVMRFVSFGSEWQWQVARDERIAAAKKDDDENSGEAPEDDINRLTFGFVDFLAYFFYVPTLFGPIITYRHFYEQVVNPEESRSFKVPMFVRQFVKVVVWFAITVACNELFMVYTVEYFPGGLELLDRFGDGALTWAHGQYFQAKYMVIYGIPWLLAHLDGGVELTPLPIFISRVYLYSNMWKYFDTGLYDFLKSYLYIPVGELFGRKTGGIVTFFFIWAWHGTKWNIAMWTVCNFVQIVIEGIVLQAANQENSWLVKYVRSKVRPSLWRHLEAIAGAFSFTFSSFAIANFFMVGQAGLYVARNVFWPGTADFWLYLLTSYAWIQTVFSYENWDAGYPL